MAVKRGVILYMRAYIYTRTNLVTWIDQVYQQISLKNQFNFNSQPKYPIFFDRTIFPIFPLPTPINKRTQSVYMTNYQREIFFSFLLFLHLATTLRPHIYPVPHLQGSGHCSGFWRFHLVTTGNYNILKVWDLRQERWVALVPRHSCIATQLRFAKLFRAITGSF